MKASIAHGDRVHVRREINGRGGRKMKALVADDEVVKRCLWESTLRGWEYEVCAATDGAAALGISEAGPGPDIALSDWVMPEIDGSEVCRIIRARPETVPVYIILRTPLDGRQNIVQGFQAGAGRST